MNKENYILKSDVLHALEVISTDQMRNYNLADFGSVEGKIHFIISEVLDSLITELE